MQFTLDSIEHVKKSLANNYPYRKIIEEAYFTKNLNDLVDESVDNYYFGVLTVGNNEDFFVYNNEVEIIKVDKNSQIYVLFSHINKDFTQLQLDNMNGQFRGFKVTII
jgi:hypothetical protein